jgi:hypothetical protein
MITVDKKQQIQQYLKSLAIANAVAVEQIEKMISLLTIALDLDDIPGQNIQASAIISTEHEIVDGLLVDNNTFSIVWQNQTCFLGNTLLFRFFERIARSPNRYVTHLDLLEDVWGGERDSTTIRGVAKRLRDRLSDSGMEKLAKSIVGSIPGYYGLILV